MAEGSSPRPILLPPFPWIYEWLREVPFSSSEVLRLWCRWGAAKVEEAEMRLFLAKGVRVDPKRQFRARVAKLSGHPTHGGLRDPVGAYTRRVLGRYCKFGERRSSPPFRRRGRWVKSRLLPPK